MHFVDRSTLLAACANSLKPHGFFFAADFYAKTPLTKDERRVLRDAVWCRCVQSGIYITIEEGGREGRR